jgi:hypothetical protein
MHQTPANPAACGPDHSPITSDTTTADSVARHPRIFLDAATIEALRQRALNGDEAWIKLRNQCDFYLQGVVNPPGIDPYPDGGSIGEGYQQDEYRAAVCNVGLAYVVAQGMDPERARLYGEKGRQILHAMSTPEDDPAFDKGYGIRNAGVGMALGYSWLRDALLAEERVRVYTAINRWIAVFEEVGLGHDHPAGNHAAGYIAAKGLAGLATEGDNPHAPAHWDDFLQRVHNGMVRPYFDENLSGGGWCQGYHYAPAAILHLLIPLVAAKTVKDLDLVNTIPPYGFALSTAQAFMHQTSPTLQEMEDRDTLREMGKPARTPVREITALAGMLASWNDPMTRAFRRFAADVRAANPEPTPRSWALWSNLLFFDPAAAQEDYTTGPRSYLARGMKRGSVRASWKRNAVWAILDGGPRTEDPNVGEELFDAGGLSIKRDDRSFLCNVGELFRRASGPNPDQFIYGENYLDDATRGLYSVLMTRTPKLRGQERGMRADGARTHMSVFEDAGPYVVMRASNLEDQYRKDDPAAPAPVSSWERTVTYLRDGLFVKLKSPVVWARWRRRALECAVNGRGSPKRSSSSIGVTSQAQGVPHAWRKRTMMRPCLVSS